ncbi:MAG: TetR/AcrR family transcriptional regulator [Gemmatimonadetes bacterium]|nr:TetR/AcrR family transcriptional regulator [Gemmatimonadota bacterium]
MSRRQQILEAFRKRLHHYGYDKTAMAEIAADVGISVGSLYLEFDSKEDILAGLVEETSREFEHAFSAIAGSDRAWAEKLREVLLARVALSDRCCREGAHAGEVVTAAQKCRRVAADKEARYQQLLERLLREGMGAGELEQGDPVSTARVLREAISVYLPPLSQVRSSEEVLEGAEALVSLLIRGLSAQYQRA